jgi:RNA polymerase sigma-70 factor (ECF subfamily)
MVNNRMDAEDVLQNAFIEVFKGIKSYQGKSTIGAWIKRIVINNNIDFLKKRRIYFEEIDDRLDVKEEESEVTTSNYDLSIVKHNIALLPDGYRVVLSLYLLEGYDHKEIGEILSITEATSKSQYSRAKKKLKKLIASDMLKREVS